MRGEKNRKQLSILILLFFVIPFIIVGAYGDGKDESKAENCYKQGMQYFRNGKLDNARKKFNESFNLFPHPLTAYLINCVCVKSGNPKDAETFAANALRLKAEPPLARELVEVAQRILDWAKRAKKDKYYIDAKADKFPEEELPLITIPKQNTLGLETPELPKGFKVQASYAGDRHKRPEGSFFIGYKDGYVWLVYDVIIGWRYKGTWQGKKIVVAKGRRADYYHILGTLFVKKVRKKFLIPTMTSGCS